jgi:hypothetical protein
MRAAHNFIDRTGIVYGELTAINRSENKLCAGKKTFWDCRCSCGAAVTVSGSDLATGNTKSCGHLVGVTNLSNWSKRRKPLFKIGEDAHYGSYLWSARKRNLSFLLSREQFNKIVSMNCEYCGSAPKSKLNGYSGTDRASYVAGLSDIFIGNGIDRVDSSIGYVEDNCVPCCTTCNSMKMKLSVEDFKNHIKKIYNHSSSFNFSLVDMCKNESAVLEFISKAA